MGLNSGFLFCYFLARFSRNTKLDYFVEFPSSFNLRPHMTPSNGAPVIYHLYATLNHEGISCRSGHYIAFTKRRNQWFSHNDSIVGYRFMIDDCA